MSYKHHPDEPRQIRNHQLDELIALAEAQLRYLRIIAAEVAPPELAQIKIQFQGDSMATPGPVTLTTAGQQVTASVVGFDQFGQPFTGTIPQATFSSDDQAQAIVEFDPATGLTTAVANGVANITASLVTAEGLSLSDTEAVTVNISGGGNNPVLSSIKVAFA